MIGSKKHALVAGAHGVTGRALVRYLSDQPDWKVTGLARRNLPHPEGVSMIEVDLLDRAACQAKIGELKDVTHVFFSAYLERPTFAEQVGPNLAMLSNLIDVVERSAPDFSRVVIVQGVKYYGVHLGPFKTPAAEDDPRHMPPNFYYDQEDFLRARQRDGGWTWSAVRPGTICGYSIGSPMNLAMVIAVFASISRELGMPLRFPGGNAAYQTLREFTDAQLLAKAMAWASTEPRCAGEAFNIKNGEPVRLEHLWPELARMFDMDCASPQPLKLVSVMADKAAMWERMVARHGLQTHAYADVVGWGFGDYLFGYEHDIFLGGNKSRRYGFHEQVDNVEMFRRLFTEFRAQRVIP